MAFESQGLGRALTMGGVTVLGLLLAIILGRLVGQNDVKMLAMFFGAAGGIAFMLMLGTRYWMMIPLTFAWTGSIGVLPLPFSVQELGMMAAGMVFIGYSIFKRVQPALRPNMADIMLWVNILYLGSVYIRHPIGIRFLGSDEIGGRPYLIVIFSILAYATLARVRITPKMAFWLPILMTASVVVAGGISVATQLYPKLGTIIYPFYNAVDISDITGTADQQHNPDEIYRLQGGANIGIELIRLLCAYFPPAIFLFANIGLIIVTLTGFALVALSGFRGASASLVAYIFLSSVLRKRFAEAIIFGLVGALAIAMLVTLQLGGIPIHKGLQRTLAWIPVPWDQQVLIDTKATSEWRFQMWKDALDRKDVIENQMFGDGFGFSGLEMERIVSGMMKGLMPGTDFFLLRGSFHSGPLSTMRTVGWVGLFFFLILTVITAWYAYQMVVMSKGTPFHALAIFLALPAIFDPLRFILIFGDFNQDFTRAIVGLGMIKLLEISLQEWKHIEKAKTTPVIQTSTTTSGV